jgi:hypothetical protein
VVCTYVCGLHVRIWFAHTHVVVRHRQVVNGFMFIVQSLGFECDTTCTAVSSFFHSRLTRNRRVHGCSSMRSSRLRSLTGVQSSLQYDFENACGGFPKKANFLAADSLLIPVNILNVSSATCCLLLAACYLLLATCYLLLAACYLLEALGTAGCQHGTQGDHTV